MAVDGANSGTNAIPNARSRDRIARRATFRYAAHVQSTNWFRSLPYAATLGLAFAATMGCSATQQTTQSSANAGERVVAANDTGVAPSVQDAAVASVAPASCESNVTASLPAPTTPASAAEPTAAPVVRACGAATRAIRVAVDRALARIPNSDRELSLRPLTRCYAAGAGAWTFDVASASVQSETNSDPTSFRIEVRPVYIDARGSVTRGSNTIRLAGGPSPYLGPVTEVGGVNVFDWDGDGTAELYLHEQHSEHEANTEASRQNRWWTFTSRGGSVREFSPLAARALRVEDVDGDRRPDFVLRSPWVLTGPCGVGDVDYVGPTLVAQSLGDGTFSTSNDVARAFVSSQCHQRPSVLFDGRDDTPEHIAREHPAFNIGCARFWGITADAIATAAERAYATLGEERARCWPKAESLRLARVEPPEAFRLECATR